MYNSPDYPDNNYYSSRPSPPERRERPIGIYVFIAILLIISVITIISISLYKAGKFNIDVSGKKPAEEEIKTDPLVLRAISNKTMISTSYILKEEAQEVQKGKLSTGIPEVYPVAKHGFNYTLIAYGPNIYSNNTVCWFKGQDDCTVSVDRIAKVKMVASKKDLNIYVSEGLLRKPILCIAWSYKTVFVELSDMVETYPPKRLKDKVDICYAPTQKDMYSLVSDSGFDKADWDLNTLKAEMQKVIIGKKETNISLTYSPNSGVVWETSVIGIKVPEEMKINVNQTVLDFYHILEENRNIRSDISIPVEAKSDEGEVRFILIDLGESENLRPTYGEDEKFGLPDTKETFIYG